MSDPASPWVLSCSVKIRDPDIKIKRTLLKNPGLVFHVPKEMCLLVGLAWTGRDTASHASASGIAFLGTFPLLLDIYCPLTPLSTVRVARRRQCTKLSYRQK